MLSELQTPNAMVEEVAFGEEVQPIDAEIPEGEMISGRNRYIFSQQSTISVNRQFCSYIKQMGKTNGIKLPDTSPMQLATKTYQKSRSNHQISSQSKYTATTQSCSLPQTASRKFDLPQSPHTLPNPSTTQQGKEGQSQIISIHTTNEVKQQPRQSKETTIRREATHLKDREKSEGHNQSSILHKQWLKQETDKWWQQRYDQKERDGQEHGQRQDQDPKEQYPDNKKKKGIESILKTSTNKSDRSPQMFSENPNEKTMKKPVLQKPKTGIFALYYILTKIGIFSDGHAHFAYKKEIELIDGETTSAHKKRLEEIKIAIEKEKTAAQWSAANKVFSWIASLVGIISGVIMIATGVGAVAGAMMIAGGLIQITNQILEISGGWKKIADLLPGNDANKKRAVISWMQIGIAVLCLILSGVGIIWGGYSNFGEAMQIATTAFGSIAAMGHGITTIGEGVTLFMFKDKMGEIKRYDKILAELKHKRRDLMEKVDWGMDRLTQLFEDLARALEFEIELFRADQTIHHH